ncbi:response regulator [Erwinia sp. AnSW2-5]|uniref:response regulator n=1 Tax=Erwinia sp. AnSW2-5 TaxID=3367692 RepID=UPI00385BDDE1
MEEQKNISVMIVDDHPLMRNGIRQLLALEPYFDIVAEASSGEEALVNAREHHPALILLDLNMKGWSGLETLHALRAENIPSRVVVLTVSDHRRDISALLEAGVNGYLLKDSEPEALLNHIILAANGGTAFSAPLQALRNNDNWKADPFINLTMRERDVMKEVAAGLSNKEVAEKLEISDQTVKVHLRNVTRKLNVRSRVAATVLWLESHHANL